MNARITLFLCCIFISFLTRAQDQNEKPLEVFQGPRISQAVEPQYPSSNLRRGEEGWVIINFMVDEEGKPFEPSVVDSMGAGWFQKRALDALQESKFVPAKSSGTPITSSMSLRYTFKIQDYKMARPAFIRKYNIFLKYYNDSDREGMAKLIKSMDGEQTKTLYEEAYLNLAKSYFSAKYGNPQEEMEHLARALYFDDRETYKTFLPEKNMSDLWTRLYMLQVKNYRFAEALDTYDIIVKATDEKTGKMLAASARGIAAIRNNGKSYRIGAKTDDFGSWNVKLFNDEFYLDKVQSRINELKLRCEKKYLLIKYKADTQYRISGDSGSCNLEVLGAPDTSFDLVQF